MSTFNEATYLPATSDDKALMRTRPDKPIRAPIVAKVKIYDEPKTKKRRCPVCDGPVSDLNKGPDCFQCRGLRIRGKR